MGDDETYDGLTLEENMPFHRREWSGQRVGWVGMALFLLAGVVGLLGPGPMSHRMTGRPGDAVRVDYFRFDRFHRDGTFRIEINAKPSDDGTVRVWVDRDYVEALEIRSISPEPVRQVAREDRIVYEFATAALKLPLTVTFSVSAEEFGGLRGTVGLVDGPEVAFEQLVFP